MPVDTITEKGLIDLLQHFGNREYLC